VLEKRVDMSEFSPEYQQKIKNYYRFSGVQYDSEMGKVAQRSRSTLDLT
jgi:hypothetical protein